MAENTDLDRVYTYHPPSNDQRIRYENLRDAAKVLARIVVDNCPQSRERSIALTHLEEMVMWANASIARNEGYASEEGE